MTEYFVHLFALFTEGGGLANHEVVSSLSDETHIESEHKEGTFVVHADDNGGIWVLLFEDPDHAERVAKDYFEATGQHAYPKFTSAHGLDDDQNIRLYRLDGSWQDVERKHYLANAS